MSITVVLPDNKRLKIKSSIKDLLSEILEKVCANQGLNSNKYSLYHNNKCLDLSLSLRLANVPLNSELNLVFEENKKYNDDLMISIQYEDKLRKTDRFKLDDTLWHVVESLFDKDIHELLYDENLIFSINYLNKQFNGRTVLQQTTLKTLGLNERVILRLNSRAKNVEPTQKYVENIKFKKIEVNPETINVQNTLQKSNIIEENSEKIFSQKLKQDYSNQVTKNEPNLEVNKHHRKDNLNNRSLMDEKSSTKIEMNEEKSIVKEKIQENSNFLIEKQDIKTEFEINLLGGENGEVLYSLDEHIKFVEEDVPEDFFEHTPSDLEHLLMELKRQRTSEAMLKTQQLRENREKERREKYDQTILRIILPYDRLVLQAMFKPNELVSDVIRIISKYIQHSDVHLFVAPPKTILPKESNLWDLKLVPCGIIYCTSINDNLPLIRDEFKNNVSTFKSVSQWALNKMKSGKFKKN